MTRTFRNLSHPIKVSVDNHLLRMVTGEARTNTCLNSCEDLVTETVIEVDGFTFLRHPNLLARSTSIINQGPNSAGIYEDRKLIGILENGKSMLLPLGGKRALHADVQPGRIYTTQGIPRSTTHGPLTIQPVGPNTLTVTTIERCACNNPGSAPDDPEPIGGFLL